MESNYMCPNNHQLKFTYSNEKPYNDGKYQCDN